MVDSEINTTEPESEHVESALFDLMDSFLERYAPASSWETADEHFSATEIVEMFNSVYPIPLEKIFDALKDAGFKCVPLSDRASFAWLLTLKRK